MTYLINRNVRPSRHLTDEKLKEIIIDIQRCSDSKTEYQLINRYNVAIMGYHNYYKIATDVNLDMSELGRKIDRVLHNRLGDRITKTGEIKEYRDLLPALLLCVIQPIRDRYPVLIFWKAFLPAADLPAFQ